MFSVLINLFHVLYLCSMKKNIVLFILITFLNNNLSAQFADTLAFPEPDMLPKFSGGMKEFFNLFNQKMVYTAEDHEQKVEGELVLTFVVDTAGFISNMEIKKGVSTSIDLQAISIIKSLPPWMPAQLHGQKIRSRYSIAMLISADKKMAGPIF